MGPAPGSWPFSLLSLQSQASSRHTVGAGQLLTVPMDSLSKQLRWTGCSLGHPGLGAGMKDHGPTLKGHLPSYPKGKGPFAPSEAPISKEGTMRLAGLLSEMPTHSQGCGQ